jgi:hypothetical protein
MGFYVLMLNAGLAPSETGQVATKAVNALSPSCMSTQVRKFPIGLGLGLGAAVSLSLWAGIFLGVKALLS